MLDFFMSLVLGTTLAPPVATDRVTTPSWTVPIDSRTSDQWLTEDGSVVYGARNGALVAIDLRNGSDHWQSPVPVTRQSAVHEGAVAAPTAHGLIFLASRDGHVVRRIALSSEPLVASSRSGFASVCRIAGGIEARGWNSDGTLRWTHTYAAPFGKLLHLGGDAIGLTGEGNGTLLVLDASDGRAVAQTDGVDELIGADGRYLWFNVLGGGIKGLDLNTNAALALHGSVVRGAARVEHGVAVAVVDGRLSTIDLRRNRVRPLHVDGRWVGGPSAGQIFVERGDGMYVQSLDDGEVSRAVAYTGESRLVAADGRIGMIAMGNGDIHIVDVVRKRSLATIATGCRYFEGFGASGATTLVHCDDDAGKSMLVGFPRWAHSPAT